MSSSLSLPRHLSSHPLLLEMRLFMFLLYVGWLHNAELTIPKTHALQPPLFSISIPFILISLAATALFIDRTVWENKMLKLEFVTRTISLFSLCLSRSLHSILSRPN